MANPSIMISLVVFALMSECYADRDLSVTGYGALQIAMLRHGEKYATNIPCYTWEDVPPLYHGMTHVRGLNDKLGNINFKVSVPVII